jgi:hypothetical protein
MSAFASLIFFVPASLWLALVLATRSDQAYLLRLVGTAWALFTPVLIAVNSWIPFTGAGDDADYFALASTPVGGTTGAFDLQKFVGALEQPGYPWALHLLNAATGNDLLAFKILNLFLFICTSLAWYRIGSDLESRLFGRQIAVTVLGLTPLWYYFAFLLKDMAIVFLQSVLLMFSIKLWARFRAALFFGFLGGLLFLALFRSALVVQSVAALSGSLLAKLIRRGSRRVFAATLLASAGAMLLATVAISSPEFMSAIGITDLSRVFGTSEFAETIAVSSQKEASPGAMFLLVYLFSETSALNPELWRQFDHLTLRGILALPWIFLLVPFFLLGFRQLARPAHHDPKTPRIPTGFRDWRVFCTPWSAVFIFIVVSASVSWIVGDTTRWRIPDMPMTAAVALLGWTHASRRLRLQATLGWLAVAAIGLTVYYLTKS